MSYKKNSENNNKKTIITILILLLIGLGIFSYLSYSDQVENNKLLAEKNDEVELIKDGILTELTTLEASYSNALLRKTELSEDLEKKKNEVIKFKNSLKKFKGVNLETLDFLKSKIKVLITNLDDLVAANDSLVTINDALVFENEKLISENKSLKSDLANKSKIIKLLAKKDKLIDKQRLKADNEETQTSDIVDFSNSVPDGELTKKIELKNRLSDNITSKVKVATYNERRGRLRETSKAKITNIIKVSFSVETKGIPKGKETKVYVVLKDYENNVINSKKSFTDTNNNKVDYTKSKTIPYKKGKKLTAGFTIKIDGKKLKKGTYSIDVYVDEKLIKQTTKILV